MLEIHRKVRADLPVTDAEWTAWTAWRGIGSSSSGGKKRKRKKRRNKKTVTFVCRLSCQASEGQYSLRSSSTPAVAYAGLVLLALHLALCSFLSSGP